jgi:hypothetical protein
METLCQLLLLLEDLLVFGESVPQPKYIQPKFLELNRCIYSYDYTNLFLSNSLSSQSSIYFSGIGLSVLENAAFLATSLFSSMKANFISLHFFYFSSNLVWSS